MYLLHIFARHSAEVVKACLSPCVWVWGFWFGFVLRCVALLCGVFVRWHLALFSAGGPFLPSLSVTIHLLHLEDLFLNWNALRTKKEYAGIAFVRAAAMLQLFLRQCRLVAKTHVHKRSGNFSKKPLLPGFSKLR
jgi:hypothetical protein